jgi:hypothetical protein
MLKKLITATVAKCTTQKNVEKHNLYEIGSSKTFEMPPITNVEPILMMNLSSLL